MRRVLPLLLSALLLAGCEQPATEMPLPEDLQTCCGGQTSSLPPSPVESRFVSEELGEIPQGPELTHIFQVRNKSSELVRFTSPPRVNLPCCASATLSKSTLAPGEEASLEVRYKTRTRPGPFDLFVQLFPDQAKRVPVDYHLSGRVEKSFVYQPRKLHLQAGEPQVITISGKELSRTVQVTEVKSNTPQVRVELLSSKPQEQVYQVLWSGEATEVEPPVVYILTDSKTFGWSAVLLKGIPSHTP